MADVSKIKLPSGTTYNIKDGNALPLTGGSVTGPVSFGDSVSIDEATVGNLVVNGSASFTNNLQANTINGIAVGSSPKFTDTTYSSLAAASGGTAVSLVTTGVKYTWNSKTSNTGTITSVKTTAGTHTTINVSSGTVTFNVPTKTSHLTNDSGYITSFTDVNVTNTAVTAATTYYLTGSTSSSTVTGGLSKHAAIKAYVTANSGTGGSARVDLGNTTATTSAGGKEGIIRLYGTSATYYVDLKAGAPSANRTITLPNKTGIVALTSDIPTVPTITLNGTSTTTPSFYAPTTAGTNGYFLKSNGSGAPTWAEIETTAAQIVRW